MKSLIFIVVILLMSCNRGRLREGNPVNLKPVDGLAVADMPKILVPGKTRISKQGELVAIHNGSIFKWNSSGDAELLHTTDWDIASFIELPQGYLTSQWKYDYHWAFYYPFSIPFKFIFFRTVLLQNGRTELISQQYYRFFNTVDNRLFIPDLIKPVYLGGKPHVFLAKEAKLENNQLSECGVRVFKRTARQNDLTGNFPFIWLASRGSEILGMHQLEAKVYFLPNEPFNSSVNDAPEYPYQQLALEGYVTPPRQLMKEKGIMSEIEFEVYRKEFFSRLGLIEFFGEIGAGYVVSYRMPKENSFEIGVQILDKRLKSNGPFLKVSQFTRVVGTSGQTIYLLDAKREQLCSFELIQ